MSELVARTGRHQQRYEDGCRLIAGCIPFKYRSSEDTDVDISVNNVEVLMINSTSGPGLLFPKGSFLIGFRNLGPIVGGMLTLATRSVEVYPSLPVGREHVGKNTRLKQGGWENDETVEEAAVREALEEAGVRGDLMHYLGDYHFKSKTLQDEFSPEGFCKAAMFALLVTQELDSWPEQCRRQRSWLTMPDASSCCRHSWMQEALENGFAKWQAGGMIRTMKATNHLDSSDDSSPDQH